MATPILMPKLGLTMETGIVVSWRKREGDPVDKGETLLEVETDKIVSEVQSPGKGILLKVLVSEGMEAKVQTVLAVIGEVGEDLSAYFGQPDSSVASPTSQRTLHAPSGAARANPSTPVERASNLPNESEQLVRQRLTPRARKLLADRGLSFAALDGIEKERITESDVLEFLERTAEAKGVAAPTGGQELVIHSMSANEKVVASRMTESFRDIPQFSLRFVAEMDHPLSLLPELKRATGADITINDLFVRAVAIALSRRPEVQFQYRPEGIFKPPQINVGFAVASGRELIVPVIHDADKKRIGEIRAETSELTARARKRELRADDVSGGTFTVSNLGMFGIASFVPIVNPGEGAILGVGAVQSGPKVRENTIQIAQVIELTLVCDHRSVNGAIAAEFCKMLREVVETQEIAGW